MILTAAATLPGLTVLDGLGRPSYGEEVDPDVLIDEIEELRKRENATILAHYYQEGEIQELADFTGDSLKLARAATKVKTDDHRLLRRPLHGRDGQDAQPGEARAAARPAGRLQPGRQLPGRQAGAATRRCCARTAASSRPSPTSTAPPR